MSTYRALSNSHSNCMLATIAVAVDICLCRSRREKNFIICNRRNGFDCDEVLIADVMAYMLGSSM